MSNKPAVNKKIKEYRKNFYETMLKITEKCSSIAEKYNVSPVMMLVCEINVYADNEDVVHCTHICTFNDAENFTYGFIDMIFDLQDFEESQDAIVKIFEKTQEYRNI